MTKRVSGGIDRLHALLLTVPLHRHEADHIKRAPEHGQHGAQFSLVEDPQSRMERSQHQVEKGRLDVAGVVDAIDRRAIVPNVLFAGDAVPNANGAESEPYAAAPEPIQHVGPLEQERQQHPGRRDNQDIQGDTDVGREGPYPCDGRTEELSHG